MTVIKETVCAEAESITIGKPEARVTVSGLILVGAVGLKSGLEHKKKEPIFGSFLRKK